MRGIGVVLAVLVVVVSIAFIVAGIGAFFTPGDVQDESGLGWLGGVVLLAIFTPLAVCAGLLLRRSLRRR
jgi:hypothetical protein